jgi:hypothetical protein
MLRLRYVTHLGPERLVLMSVTWRMWCQDQPLLLLPLRFALLLQMR